jgi:hypothetical protein
MSFAYTAATIGHHVTLFEKSNEIGGANIEWMYMRRKSCTFAQVLITSLLFMPSQGNSIWVSSL